MFLGKEHRNLRSILKPEVELTVFLRMRSNKITKNAEKCTQNPVLRPNFPRVYVFGTGNPNLRSILKPEVELMMFLRMRSNKNIKNAGKCP